MLRGMKVKVKKKTVSEKFCMTHGNPSIVLTTDYSVSYVRFAVLIPRRLQKNRISQTDSLSGFSFCTHLTNNRQLKTFYNL